MQRTVLLDGWMLLKLNWKTNIGYTWTSRIIILGLRARNANGIIKMLAVYVCEQDIYNSRENLSDTFTLDSA